MKGIVGEVLKGVVFTAIGAALFAANPRFGKRSGNQIMCHDPGRA